VFETKEMIQSLKEIFKPSDLKAVLEQLRYVKQPDVKEEAKVDIFCNNIWKLF
jgi:hypothetical protein